jgi:hypothetical protein
MVNGKNGDWRIANCEWGKTASSERRAASGQRRRMANGEWRMEKTANGEWEKQRIANGE